MLHSALVGFGLGFFAVLQLGPMSLLLIRSTLRGGSRVGLAIGAGIAPIDSIYAACGAAGVAPLLEIEPVRWMLGLAGGAFLVVLGLRTLHSGVRTRLAGEAVARLAMIGVGGTLAYATRARAPGVARHGS